MLVLEPTQTWGHGSRATLTRTCPSQRALPLLISEERGLQQQIQLTLFSQSGRVQVSKHLNSESKKQASAHTSHQLAGPHAVHTSCPIPHPCRPLSFQQPLAGTKDLPQTVSGMFSSLEGSNGGRRGGVIITDLLAFQQAGCPEPAA